MDDVLITGADGFIGRNLVRKLKERKIKPVKFKGDIVHLAALTSLPESIESPLDYFLVNELGTVGVLEYARQNEIKRVIFTSSVAAKTPNNPYGLSKLNAEEWCKLYAKLYGIETIILRPYNVYGREGHGVINIFAGQQWCERPLIINGDGTQTRDFIHVDDICSAIIELLTDKQTSINELAERIRKLSKKKLEDIL